MSEPVERYEPSYYGDMRWSKDGAWVEYADYARLKAEVERLIKAGDALVGEGETMAHDVSWVPYVWDNRVAEWHAAKEGKPSV